MSATPPWLVIAKREFLERVRTKWFVIATLLGPIGMVALIVVPAVLASSEQAVKIKVVDHGSGVGPALVQTFAIGGWKAEEVPATTTEAALLDEVAREKINGFISLPPDLLAGTAATYQGDNASNLEVVGRLKAAVFATAIKARANKYGVRDDQLTALMAPVDVIANHTTGTAAGASGMATFIVGYAVMFIIYMAIMLYAINVMRSVVQEKTSRVVELMVAAAKPRALMAGKILGVGAVGLVQLGVWLGMAVLTMKFRTELLGAVGVSSKGGISVPPLHPQEIAVILGYFVLGYFFYAALFASIGAMVSSEQEAQSAQTPVMMALIVPMACVQMVANAPRGGAAAILTLVPFSSPVLMPMRYLLGGATTLEVVASLGILLVSTAIVVVLAARIYRVGILMYGKRPSLRELVRWLRY